MPETEPPMLSMRELSSLVTSMQTKVAALEAENESLRETLQNLSHENELYKRRIYGNKTERLRTSEMQLTLSDLLADEKRLQKELNDAVTAAEQDAGGVAPFESTGLFPRLLTPGAAL